MKTFFVLGCAILRVFHLFSLEKVVDYNDFEALMGKKTVHWCHVTQDKDRALLSRLAALYHKNKEGQFSHCEEYKVPPVLHVIWLGPYAFPPDSVENLRSWIAYHPTWRIKLWTDREREPPCEGVEIVPIRHFPFSRLQRCFEDSRNWAEKSDLLRYEILYREGGVYIDHDTYCLASFEGLVHGYDFFCCLEPPHEAFVGANVTCWNGLIGSRPGHPVLARAIDHVATHWDAVGDRYRGRDLYSQVEIVMQRTYIAFTHALEGTLDHPGNTDIVFPAAYFFAKSGIPSIYCKHFCQTTWDLFKPRTSDLEKWGEKALDKMRRKTRTTLWITWGSLLISSLFLGLSLVYIKRRGEKHE